MSLFGFLGEWWLFKRLFGTKHHHTSGNADTVLRHYCDCDDCDDYGMTHDTGDICDMDMDTDYYDRNDSYRDYDDFNGYDAGCGDYDEDF